MSEGEHLEIKSVEKSEVRTHHLCLVQFFFNLMAFEVISRIFMLCTTFLTCVAVKTNSQVLNHLGHHVFLASFLSSSFFTTY
jgi:hypothetical protein